MDHLHSYFIPPMALTEKTFLHLVKKLSLFGRIMKLSDAVSKLNENGLKGKNFAITFDDGYLDNYTIANKILLQEKIPATFFIPVNAIDQAGVFWWDYLYSIMGKSHCRPFEFFFEKFCRNRSTNSIITSANIQVLSREMVQILNCMGEIERRQILLELENEFGKYEGQRLLMNWNEVKALNQLLALCCFRHSEGD